jgi:transcriptional regulator with XRE-family HTH domain
MLSKDFAKKFGKVVRKHRKRLNLSQEELAEKADLAPKMISLIERFERNPSLNVAHSIALGLSVPLWRLIKDAQELDVQDKSIKSPANL